MKNYKVNIDFRDGASFSRTVQSQDSYAAQGVVLTFARASGFAAPIKKITVTEEVTA